MDVVLRRVTEEDLPIFFEHQRDPEANRMAAFAARDRDAFMAHWTRKVLGDESVVKRAVAVVVDGQVAGNIVSWEHDGRVQIGYWIGREFWGKGIATRALGAFLHELTTRPLYAYAAAHNVASIRVLEKCGFAISDEVLEASDEPEDGIAEVMLKLES
jgi:RimJ/RimL family protein N-acetyltransferase